MSFEAKSRAIISLRTSFGSSTNLSPKVRLLAITVIGNRMKNFLHEKRALEKIAYII